MRSHLDTGRQKGERLRDIEKHRGNETGIEKEVRRQPVSLVSNIVWTFFSDKLDYSPKLWAQVS